MPPTYLGRCMWAPVSYGAGSPYAGAPHVFQMWMSAPQITGDVNTPARTSWGPSSAAARLATNWTMTKGAASVSACALPRTWPSRQQRRLELGSPAHHPFSFFTALTTPTRGNDSHHQWKAFSWQDQSSSPHSPRGVGDFGTATLIIVCSDDSTLTTEPEPFPQSAASPGSPQKK